MARAPAVPRETSDATRVPSMRKRQETYVTIRVSSSPRANSISFLMNLSHAGSSTGTSLPTDHSTTDGWLRSRAIMSRTILSAVAYSPSLP